MNYNSRVIIIKNKDYREADKLVTLFSEKEGKIRAIARGVKKPGSSLRACVQPFCHSYLSFSGNRELDLITQGRLLDFYGNVREDIERVVYAVYIMELLDKALLDNVPMPSLYAVVLKILQHFNDQGLNLLILRYFELFLLAQLGYRPELNRCIICGREKAGNIFSMSDGGLVCSNCSAPSRNNFILSGESIALLRLMLSGRVDILNRVKASDGALKQLEMFLEKYLEYYLERTFNMKYTIRQLKKAMLIVD